MPYSGCSDTLTLLKIQAGEKPQRPSNGIADPVWEFLEKCWGVDPTTRPPTAEVLGAFSEFRSLPQAVHAPEGRSAIEELPGKLKLQVQGIKISLNKPNQQRFYIRFRYGEKDHTTSPTNAVTDDEHIWFVCRPPLLRQRSKSQTGAVRKPG